MSDDQDADRPLAPGLYFVATPIGNARDITLRALEVLRRAEVIAAEDTRSARRLMEIHGIALAGRALVAYHDHNGPRQRPRLLAALAAGRSVAVLSDAGSPLVADPGFALGRAAQRAGHAVTAVPGPSAVITALTVSGLAPDRFLFAGFLSTTRGARRRQLEELAAVPATLIFFESAKRIHESLDDLCETLGNWRQGAICRELTKAHEEVLRGPLDTLRALIANRRLKGEIVLLVARDDRPASTQQMEAALREALKTQSVKDAAAAVAGKLGLPRRAVYQAALAMARER